MPFYQIQEKMQQWKKIFSQKPERRLFFSSIEHRQGISAS
jgi:hypothetical protein